MLQKSQFTRGLKLILVSIKNYFFHRKHLRLLSLPKLQLFKHQPSHW